MPQYDVIPDGDNCVGIYKLVDANGKECVGLFNTVGIADTKSGARAVYLATYQQVKDKILDWSKGFEYVTYHIAIIRISDLESIHNGEVVYDQV